MEKRKNKAFTLVELIIVIIIIAILATVAFLTLGEYTNQTRDSRRFADKSNIEKVLEIYKAQNGIYPTFDEENGKKIFGEGTYNQVGNMLSNIPKDPLTNKFYKIEIDTDNKARVVIEQESTLIAGNQQNEEKISTGELEQTCDRSSAGRFQVNGQLITDTKTGLIWSKEDSNDSLSLEDAKKFCENLETGGKQNWRLPDITELKTIRNLSCYGPATYSEFDNITYIEGDLGGYWSSTNDEDHLNFSLGDTNSIVILTILFV